MTLSRRDFIQTASVGAIATSIFPHNAFSQQTALNPIDRLLWRSVENAPWIATPGNVQKPIYIMWAPWCGICQSVMIDYAAGKLPDVQIRWIGVNAKTSDQRLSVAAIAKSNSPDLLRKVILRETSDRVATDETFINRVLATELLFLPLQKHKNARGYPTFIYSDGRQVMITSGYNGPQIIAGLAAQVQPTSVTKPDSSYLDDSWTDLGPASGQPYKNDKGYTIYSLPSENAVAVNVVSPGSFWPVPTKRRLTVRNQKWVSVSTTVRIGNGQELDGYIRTA